jgi:hypothetical protein
MTRYLFACGLAILGAASAAADGPTRAPVDKAVERALDFLYRTQDPDGAWRAGRTSKNPAITALAVMAWHLRDSNASVACCTITSRKAGSEPA